MLEDQNWFYTNTFVVKDPKAFRAFCTKYNLEIFVEGPFIGCFCGERGLSQIAEESSDEQLFLRELASHLEDEYVVIAVDARVTQRKHCCTSWQITYAINNHGELREFNPSSIFSLARGLGQYTMPLQDMYPPENGCGEEPGKDDPQKISSTVQKEPVFLVSDLNKTRLEITTIEDFRKVIEDIAVKYLRLSPNQQQEALNTFPRINNTDEPVRQIGTAISSHLAPTTIQDYATLLRIVPAIWEASYPQIDTDEDEEPTPQHIYDITLREYIIECLKEKWKYLQNQASVISDIH